MNSSTGIDVSCRSNRRTAALLLASPEIWEKLVVWVSLFSPHSGLHPCAPSHHLTSFAKIFRLQSVSVSLLFLVPIVEAQSNQSSLFACETDSKYFLNEKAGYNFPDADYEEISHEDLFKCCKSPSDPSDSTTTLIAHSSILLR